MRIVVLAENTTCSEQFTCEHGLSLLIETEREKILFDAGQTDLFAENAEKLGISLNDIDFAILSHGHFDHSGGMLTFLRQNQTAPLYIHREASIPHVNGAGKDIGVASELVQSDRLVLTEDILQIAPGITLYSCNDRPRPYPTDTCGLCKVENGKPIPDDFCHEQYLLIEENGKQILISGCSHKGILNIAHWFQPDVLVGGFHFMTLDPAGAGKETLETAAQQLLRYPTTYYTGHCTGEAQYVFLKERMGDRLHRISTGMVLEI